MVNKGLFPPKNVNKHAVGPINVIYIGSINVFQYFWTNLEPTFVDLIFHAPNVANLRFR